MPRAVESTWKFRIPNEEHSNQLLLKLERNLENPKFGTWFELQSSLGVPHGTWLALCYGHDDSPTWTSWTSRFPALFWCCRACLEFRSIILASIVRELLRSSKYFVDYQRTGIWLAALRTTLYLFCFFLWQITLILNQIQEQHQKSSLRNWKFLIHIISKPIWHPWPKAHKRPQISRGSEGKL